MFASTNYDYHFQISQYGMMPPEVSPEMEKPAKWKLSYSNDPAPACPRCASPNTKFCYYNNYSLSQPRYFCKGCRRYWTKGGTLRNVPFGGGCRKTRRRANTNYKRSVRSNERIDRNQDGEFAGGPVSGGGSEIDMAAVFANFLNDKSPSSSSTTTGGNFDQESSPSDESNGVATTTHPSECFDWNICQENDSVPGFYQNMEETQKQDLLLRGDEFLNKMSQEDEFGPGMHALQDLLNDEEIQDVLWSDNWHPFDLDRSDILSKP